MKLSRKIAVLYFLSWVITTLVFVGACYIEIKYGKNLILEQKLKYYCGGFAAIDLLLHTIMLSATNRLIKRKIKSLDKQINSINTTNDRQGRIQDIKGNDEFARLARDINNMFQSLEDQNNLIISNEKKYSNLVEGLDNGYAYLKMLKNETGEVKDAFIVEVNASLAYMLGMDKESLIAGSFIKLFSPFIKEKDIVPKILRTVGGKHQSVFRNSVRLGVDRWALLTVYPIENQYFAMIFTDISENRKFAEEMKHVANYDVLTGVRNRFSLYNYMEQLRVDKQEFTIYFIDLDHFKTINDTLGHNVGDEVLVRTAETVQKLGGENFSVGRLGGDEFLGIRLGSYSIKEVEEFGQEIIVALNAVKSYNGYPYKIEASLGASRFLVDTENIETLLKCGDIALYKSKKDGRNKIRVFDNEMKEEVDVQGKVKAALEEGELIVYYQSIFDVKTDSVIGAEALIRWKHGNEEIEPEKFLQIAKESDDIIEIDNLVLKRACGFCKKIREQRNDNFEISINASSKFLKQKGLVEKVKNILFENELEPNALKIEITEKEVIDDINDILEVLNGLKKLGVKIALDDFGLGNSSFGHIKLLPLNTIKIDKSLLKRVDADKTTLAIISSLIQLTHNLNLDVIVEGVETEKQLYLLKQLDCDMVQGFYLSNPVPEEEYK